MAIENSRIDALRNAYRLLKSIGNTGFAGIDSNVEKAMISIKLALFNLGQEETIETPNIEDD